MTLKDEFEQYAEDIKRVKTRPTDKELGDLYGLYKQASFGDINFDRPGFIELTAKAKWDAWNLRKVVPHLYDFLSSAEHKRRYFKEGMSEEDAMNAYISVAKKVIEKYGM